jgi:hypothetical protein
MRVYLTMGPDGRILVQARIEEDNIIADLLHYVAQGDQFNGVDYNTLAQSTPGIFDLPDGQEEFQGVDPDVSEVDQDQQKE